jgi:hypothetical protein
MKEIKTPVRESMAFKMHEDCETRINREDQAHPDAIVRRSSPTS